MRQASLRSAAMGRRRDESRVYRALADKMGPPDFPEQTTDELMALMHEALDELQAERDSSAARQIKMQALVGRLAAALNEQRGVSWPALERSARKKSERISHRTLRRWAGLEL